MRKVIGVLLVLLLVYPLLLASMVVFTVVNWGLDRDLYVDALTSEVLYEQLYSEDLIYDLIKESGQNLQGVDPVQLGMTFRVLLPPTYLDDQVAKIVNNAFDFLERKTDTLKLEIELQGVKDELTGPNQDVVLLNIVRALPECQEGMTFNPEEMNLCKPALIDDEDLLVQGLKQFIPVLIGFIPDSIELNESISFSELIRDVPQPWRAYIETITLDQIVYVLVGITLFLWFLTALIAGKDWGERLKWLGWMLLLPAVLVLMLGILGSPRYAWNWISDLPSAPFRHLPATAVYTIEDVAINLISGLRIGFITVGGICLAVGIGFVAWGAVSPNREE